MNEPIKRHESIQPLSRDHHHGLLLCWKIKTGFAKGVSTDRMKVYVDWFYEKHIKKHFEIEEEFVFPVLGNDHELIKQALDQHKTLMKLFTDNSDVTGSLKNIQTELEKHIRFQERVLFNEIQKVASEKQLKIIKEHHSDDKFVDNLSDQFWTNN